MAETGGTPSVMTCSVALNADERVYSPRESSRPCRPASGMTETWQETTEAQVQLKRRLGTDELPDPATALGGRRAEMAKGLELIERVRKRQAATFRRLKPYRLTHPLKFMNLGGKEVKENLTLCDGSTREFMRLKLLKDMQPGLYKNNTFWLKRMKTYWLYHDPILATFEERIELTDKRKVHPQLSKLSRDVRKFAARIISMRETVDNFERTLMSSNQAMNDFISKGEGRIFAEERAKIECEIRNAKFNIATIRENSSTLIDEIQVQKAELRELQETVVVDEYLPFGKDVETLKEDETRLAFEHEEVLQRLKMFEDLLQKAMKSMRDDLRKLRANWQENGELDKATCAMAEFVTMHLKPSKLEVMQQYIGSPISREGIRNLIKQESGRVTAMMKRIERHFPMI